VNLLQVGGFPHDPELDFCPFEGRFLGLARR